MTERGYLWRAASRGDYVLRTEWTENGTSGATGTLISYLVQGERHPSGGCILRVSRGAQAAPTNPAGDLAAMTTAGAGTSGENRGLLVSRSCPCSPSAPSTLPRGTWTWSWS